MNNIITKDLIISTDNIKAVNKRIQTLISGRNNIVKMIKQACEDSIHTTFIDNKLTKISDIDYKNM